jgi:hypothetical protein
MQSNQSTLEIEILTLITIILHCPSPLSSNKALSQDDDEEPSTMLLENWKDKREANEAKVRQLRERE